MSTLVELAPLGDDLMLVVLGPGVGESVLIGWPPDSWMIVDSFCRTAGALEVHPAIKTLEAFDGSLRAVALTHPHEDHTRGFASLIDRLGDGGRVGWWPEMVTQEGRWSTSNAALAQRNGANEQAVAAIHRAWTENPSSRWDLIADAPPLALGDASIQVLTPLHSTVEEHKSLASPNANELSSAMVFRWKQCAITLGADLVNLRGWDQLEIGHGPFAFAENLAMKVSHHGSREAQHPVALGATPRTERLLVTSPYSRGGKVPDYRDGEDVERLLALTDDLYLSGHHGPRPSHAESSPVRRRELAPSMLSLGGLGEIMLDAPQPSIDDCWVAARWAADGTRLSVERGRGSLLVVD